MQKTDRNSRSRPEGGHKQWNFDCHAGCGSKFFLLVAQRGARFFAVDDTPPVVTIINNTGSTTLTCTQLEISVTASGADTYTWDNGLGNNTSPIITSLILMEPIQVIGLILPVMNYINIGTNIQIRVK